MKFIVIILMSILVTSCSCSNIIAQDNIESASYQSWTAGVRGGGGGINFNLKLSSELPKGVVLKRVVFKGFEVKFVQQDALFYQAAIITGVNQERFEGDQKNVSSSTKSDIKTNDNEAILIFSKNGKEYQQKITNVVEKPALEYPSAKPKF